jgi:hypothetical protein
MIEIKTGQRWKYIQSLDQEWNIGEIVSVDRSGGYYRISNKSSKCNWTDVGDKHYIVANDIGNYILLRNQDIPNKL